MKELFEEINGIFDKANQFKEQARISKSNNKFFINAAKSYHKAGFKSNELLSMLSDQNVDEKLQLCAYKNYYYSEKYYCLCTYYYNCRVTNKALRYHNLYIKNLNQAIKQIEQRPDGVSDAIINNLKSHLDTWEFFMLGGKILGTAIKARDAWDCNRTIEAFDYYQSMLGDSKKAYDVAVGNVECGKLPEVYKRIAGGNYIATAANVASALAKKSYENHFCNEDDQLLLMLEYILKAYKLSKYAYQTNPEWQEYYQGSQVMYMTVKKIVTDITDWKKLYIKFNINSEVHQIMRSIDEKKYNKLNKELNPENNKWIKLWSIGAFFILLGVIVFSGISMIAYNFDLLKFFSIILPSEFIFLVVGALILKTTGDLSENGFIKLKELVFKYQFKFYKKISIKNDGDEKN